jgi:hypothetical protein
VPRAYRLPVAVHEMHVTHQWSGGTKRVSDAALFDIHVEQVAQQLDVSRSQSEQKLNGVALAIEQVCFVAIQRLIK